MMGVYLIHYNVLKLEVQSELKFMLLTCFNVSNKLRKHQETLFTN